MQGGARAAFATPSWGPARIKGAWGDSPKVFPAFHKRRTTFAPRSQARSNVSHTAPRAQRTTHRAQAPESPAQPPKIKFHPQSKAQKETSPIREPSAHAEKIRYASEPTAVPPPSAELPARPFPRALSRNHSTFLAYPKYKEIFFEEKLAPVFANDANNTKSIFFKKNCNIHK